MYTLYGIKTCDTVRKARDWLAQHGVAYRYHDFRSDGCPAELLADFIARTDWRQLLNRNSASWRQLNDDQRADLTADKARALLLLNPTLIKRPILDVGDALIVGFAAKTGGYAAYLPVLELAVP